MRFPKEGGMRPLSVVWEDGRTFTVNKTLRIGREAAHTGAALPVRFLCVVEGKTRPLYFEPQAQRWFVEIPIA